MSRTRHGRSPTGAPLLCRTFFSAAGILLLCGCGAETARVSVLASQHDSSPAGVSRSRPANLDSAARLVARPIETDRAVPTRQMPLTTMPSPRVEEEQRPVLAAAGENLDSAGEAIAPAASSEGERPQSGGAGPSLERARGETLSSGDPSVRGEVESTAIERRTHSALSPSFAAAYAVTPERAVDSADAIAPLAGASEPTPQLIAVARQADAHVGRGLRLAERGATYAARAEFTRALQLAAAALDEQRRTTAHTRALANGLRALEEAEDLAPAVGTGGQPVAAIEAIVRSHRTPVLRLEPNGELPSASAALQAYLSYGQDRCRIR
jgi:hypothetical protein